MLAILAEVDFAVISCTCKLRAAPFGAELGKILVGPSTGVTICGRVRACTLERRERCAGGECAGRTWRERHTQGFRASWPRASDRSRVKQLILPTTARITGKQIGQASKQENEQCGSNPPKGVPQANSHNTWALVSQGGHLWPIANWEQRYATLPHGRHPHPCRRYSGRLARLPERMAPFGLRRGPRLPFAGRRNRGGQPQAATSMKAAPNCSASLSDLLDDLLLLVFNHLCASDRMALADVSTSWRTACAVDDLYATAAVAVMSSAATPTECNEFGRTNLGPPGGVRRDGLLLGELLVPQAAMAS